MFFVPTLPLECQEALGMESGQISDSQISASSWYDDYDSARMGRLYNQERSGAWTAATNDTNQWLQIDLGSYYARVTRIATQGRYGVYTEWVTEYKLQHSEDGVNFQYYREQGQTTDKVMCNKFTETSRRSEQNQQEGMILL